MVCDQTIHTCISFLLNSVAERHWSYHTGLRDVPSRIRYAGTLDDATFPSEELSVLNRTVLPCVHPGSANVSGAILIEPFSRRQQFVAVGHTFVDWVVVAALLEESPPLLVLERRFARFGILAYLDTNVSQCSRPYLILRKAIGTLEAVQRQARQVFPKGYYAQFMLSREDVLAQNLLRPESGSARSHDPTFEDVLPAFAPMASYLTIATIGHGGKFTVVNSIVK